MSATLPAIVAVIILDTREGMLASNDGTRDREHNVEHNVHGLLFEWSTWSSGLGVGPEIKGSWVRLIMSLG